MKEFDGVIIEKDLWSLGSDKVKDYIAHVYCDKGSCSVVFNERLFTINAGDCAIFTITKLVCDIEPSKDFEATCIYVSENYIALANPYNSYQIKGTISLFNNPVIWLDDKRRRICKKDFIHVEDRLNNKEHHFYQEALQSALCSLFIDYFDFHYHINRNEKHISPSQADIIQRFFTMLEQGEYKQHREVSYYADKLFITSKHLSQICKTVSGFSANYWINRFTSIELQRHLKDSSLTLTQIADLFNFSSLSYFSKYSTKFLKQSPSDYRKKGKSEK